jgi:transposase
VEPAATGRPSYHPSVLLKLYVYGYLNRVQSSVVLANRRALAWSGDDSLIKPQ